MPSAAADRRSLCPGETMTNCICWWPHPIRTVIRQSELMIGNIPCMFPIIRGISASGDGPDTAPPMCGTVVWPMWGHTGTIRRTGTNPMSLPTCIKSVCRCRPRPGPCGCLMTDKSCSLPPHSPMIPARMCIIWLNQESCRKERKQY